MTKQLRQGIVPTHVLGSTGTGQDDDLGHRALADLKTDLALDNVDNTSDADKPVSTAVQTELTGLATLADDLARDEFFNMILRPSGIDIPPNVLYWPSPYKPDALTLDATIARAGSGTIYNKFGLIESIGADIIRRDYDPATGAFLGALAEPQRTNLLDDPDDLTSGNWDRFNISNVELDASVTQFPVYILTDTDDAEPVFHVFRQRAFPNNTEPRVATWYVAAGTKHIVRVSMRATGDSAYVEVDLNNGSVLGSDLSSGGLIGTAFFQVRPVGLGFYAISFIAPEGIDSTAADRSSVTILDGPSNRSYQGDGTGTIKVALPQAEIGAFPTSPILTGNTTYPADVLTIPQVFDRRRGFICWEGVLEFDPDADVDADAVNRFPFGRSDTEQSIRIVGDKALQARSPSATDAEGLTVADSLQNRLVRVAYWWDSDADIFGLSVDGVSKVETGETVDAPPDEPIRFGQTDFNREGKSHTNWIYISYNIPTIEQIEALTGAVAP